MKSYFAALTGIALCLAPSMLGQNSDQRRKDTVEQVSKLLAEMWKSEIPDLRLESFSRKEVRQTSKAHPFRSGESRDRVSDISLLLYTFRSDWEMGDIGVEVYGSEEDAVFWYRRAIQELPIQPPVPLSELGDEAVHFAEAGINGSLFLRRGRIAAHINAKTEATSKYLARVLDSALRRIEAKAED